MVVLPTLAVQKRVDVSVRCPGMCSLVFHSNQENWRSKMMHIWDFDGYHYPYNTAEVQTVAEETSFILNRPCADWH